MRCRVESLIPARPCSARSTVPMDTCASSAIKWIPRRSLAIDKLPHQIQVAKNAFEFYAENSNWASLNFYAYHRLAVILVQCRQELPSRVKEMHLLQWRCGLAVFSRKTRFSSRASNDRLTNSPPQMTAEFVLLPIHNVQVGADQIDRI